MAVRATLLATLLTFAAVGAAASEEGVLALTSFHFATIAYGKAGAVVVDGTQDGSRITRLSVAAFGRTFTLAHADLKRIEAGLINGATISSEKGYEATGGEAVYITLLQGFTGATRRVAIVTVRENGAVRVEPAP